MNKNEIIQKRNLQIYSFNSSNNITKKNRKIQNIPDDSLFNISYPSPKKEIINPLKINNYINKKNPQTTFYNNNNSQEDQRLFFSLNMLGLNKYYTNFIQNNINFQLLLALTNNDMAEMGIPLNAQKTIQNFILEYLNFGSQYNLEELKEFFLQRKPKVNNRNDLKRNNRKSFSYDSHQHKIKKIIGNANPLNSVININNYISDNNKNIINLSKKLHKSASVLNRNKINNYSEVILNNIHNKNLPNTINDYMIIYNNKNKSNKSKIPYNYNMNIMQKINKSEGNLINSKTNNFKNMVSQQNIIMNTYSNINNLCNYSENNNFKTNQENNQFRMIGKKHISNSSQALINKLDRVLMKNRQRKIKNGLKVNNSYDNYLNKNKNKKINKINNNLFDNIENNYINYYSDNNESFKKVNNSSFNRANNINDLNQSINYINITTNPNNIDANNSFINNYEINSFYTGNSSKINSFNKINGESDCSIQLFSGSKNNTKITKYKKFKDKQMKEINQLLENSSNNKRQNNLDNNIKSNSEKNRGMILNNLNNYYIYNNYRTSIGNDLIKKNLNAKKNESINMNNNNLNLQSYMLKNKIKYYRNTNNIFYNDANNLSNININNIDSLNNKNITNNESNSNNIFNYFKKNNKNNNNFEIPFNHSLIKSEKKNDVFNELNFNQIHQQKPQYNNTQNNFYNNKNYLNNTNYSFNNYISDFNSSYSNNSNKKNKYNNMNNNIYNNINRITNNINSINSNLNNINFINKIDDINNINNINNIKLINSTNNNINYNQNIAISNKITPFQQYNKSSHKLYRENFNSFQQNTAPSMPRPISNSESKIIKHNKIKGNPVNLKNNSRNPNKINLNQNLSKNQLKKIKIGIKNGILKFNN